MKACGTVLSTISHVSDAPHLQRFVPVLVVLLREEHSAALVRRHSVRLVNVLRIVSTLIEKDGLPLEPAAPDLLALVCASLVYASPTPATPAADPGAKAEKGHPAKAPRLSLYTGDAPSSIAAAAAAASVASGGKSVAARAAQKPHFQYSGGWHDASAFEEQLRERALAAHVFGALLSRLAASEPDVTRAVAAHAARLFVRILTDLPRDAARGVDWGGPEKEEEGEADLGSSGSSGSGLSSGPGRGRTPASSASTCYSSSTLRPSSFPTPGPSLFGALLGLQRVGAPLITALLAPIASELSVLWSSPLNDGFVDAVATTSKALAASTLAAATSSSALPPLSAYFLSSASSSAPVGASAAPAPAAKLVVHDSFLTRANAAAVSTTQRTWTQVCLGALSRAMEAAAAAPSRVDLALL